MANKPREKPAEEPSAPAPASSIPASVLAASEAFRLDRDARRYRFLRAHPALGRVLAFQKIDAIDSWVDEQIAKRGWR